MTYWIVNKAQFILSVPCLDFYKKKIKTVKTKNQTLTPKKYYSQIKNQLKSCFNFNTIKR